MHRVLIAVHIGAKHFIKCKNFFSRIAFPYEFLLYATRNTFFPCGIFESISCFKSSTCFLFVTSPMNVNIVPSFFRFFGVS